MILGFLIYGRVAEAVFAPDDRKTPAVAINDGVDCVPMKPWKAFLVQLLNIAGTGPIFGALMGAVFGPVVFLWIVFGSILGGAAHNQKTGRKDRNNYTEMRENKMLNVNKTVENQIATVSLEGRLDTVTAPELENDLQELLPGLTELKLDFANLDYISSAGLRVLLATQKIMDKQGEMTLTNVSEAVMEIFEVTGFTDILTIT